jgi:hypothetical protein
MNPPKNENDNPVSQQQLDPMGCSNPDCDCDDAVLHMHPRCHDEGVTVRYEKPFGQMVVACVVCEAEVLRVAIRETLP